MKLDYKRIWKKLKKLNFTSVMFFALSLISSTFAWFAFSNIVDNDMNIDIKAWKVDISEGDDVITNTIAINLDNFYPGVEDVSKSVTISNAGDISSAVSYKINYLRIFDEEFDVTEQDVLFNKLAQDYPFTVNFNLDNEYLDVSNDTQFSYVVSWPLDSGDDNLDAQWGNKAYDFLVDENNKKKQDANYVIRDCISIEVELVVEQFVGGDLGKTDVEYSFGNYKYLNSTTQAECSMGDSGCYKFFVLEKENIVSDDTVTMMADPSQMFTTSTYDNKGEVIDAYGLFEVISTDIYNTLIIRPGLSSRVLGSSSDLTYYDDILYDLKNRGGYIEFSTIQFPILNSGDCYWISHPGLGNLAVKYFDDDKARVYFETSNVCKSVPYIFYTK